jgi:ABC-type glutathione transport system ATPase component
VPNLADLGDFCAFADRCPNAVDQMPCSDAERVGVRRPPARVLLASGRTFVMHAHERPSVGRTGDTLVALCGLRKEFCRTANESFGRRRKCRRLSSASNSRIEPDRRFGLVGESGSGKSTIARMILSSSGPTRGELSSDGRSHLAADEGAGSGITGASCRRCCEDPSAALSPRPQGPAKSSASRYRRRAGASGDRRCK